MSADENTTAVQPEKVTRRGPRKEADIRAEIEAEMRATLEAEMAEQRAALQAEFEAKEAEIKAEREANDVSPVTGLDLSMDPTLPDAVTIHFVKDGMTLLGKVWYQGEELTLVPGTDQWANSMIDRTRSFVSLDTYEQEARWGQEYFRQGPWRGKRLDEIDDPDLTDAERAQLAKAAKQRDARYAALNR